jgi:hypothetical protein
MNTDLLKQLQDLGFIWDSNYPSLEWLIERCGDEDYFSLEHIIDANQIRLWRACAPHKGKKLNDLMRAFGKTKKEAVAKLLITLQQK